MKRVKYNVNQMKIEINGSKLRRKIHQNHSEMSIGTWYSIWFELVSM
jgi:hypothetical protein